MRTRNGPLAVALAVVLVAAAGCSSGSSGSQVVSGLEKTNIVVDAFPAIDSAGLYIAEMDGLFAKQGLNVTIHTALSTQEEIDGAESGKYDITTGDYVTYIDDEVTGNPDDHDAPVRLRIFAEASFLQPNVLTVLVKAKSPVESVAGLKGRIVSVNAPDDIGTILLDSLLIDHGLQPDQVRWDNHEQFPDVGKALSGNMVNAAFAPEPFVTLDEVNAGTEELADLDQGSTTDFPIQGYAVTEAWARQNPNTLKAFTAALEQGQTIAETSRAAVEKAVEKFLQMPAQVAALISLPAFPSTLDPIRIQRVPDAMYRFGLLGKMFNIDQMIG